MRVCDAEALAGPRRRFLQSADAPFELAEAGDAPWDLRALVIFCILDFFFFFLIFDFSLLCFAIL